MKSSFRAKGTFKIFEESAEGALNEAILPYQSHQFSYGDRFWDWVQSDPTLRAEMEQRISEKINTRLETMRRDFEATLRDEASELLHRSERTGRAEGVELGRKQAYEESKATLDDQMQKLAQVVDTVLESKERMLLSHETAWLEALEYILIQCLIPRESEIIAAVQRWLSEELSEFSRTKAVRFIVSPLQYSEYQAALAQVGVPNLVLVVDEKMRPGDVQLECDNGGILFSDREALDRLRTSIRMLLAKK